MSARDKFFGEVRVHLFHGALRAPQVDGMNAILDAWDKLFPGADPRWVAYSLGTTYRETATQMQPIDEFGHGRGHAYGIVDPATHQRYYGRGFVQLTWKTNYEKLTDRLRHAGVLTADESLVTNPELAKRLDVASAVMIYGMVEGIFSGKKLATYFAGDHEDWTGARHIINGTDVAKLVASYALAFYHALET